MNAPAQAPLVPASEAMSSTARALRVVLVLTLDRAAASACLGDPRTDEATLWSSTLYTWAAETAARSPVVWCRCASALDAALAEALSPYRDAPVTRIVEALCAEEEAMAGHEIAAALWALVRRREPALGPVTARLAQEAEVLITRSFARTSEPSRCLEAHAARAAAFAR